jgi:hypothetical protein
MGEAMISVITTVYNSKFDLDQLVRYLHQWNDPTGFEVVVAHDNRVSDGSADMLTALESQFSNVSHVATTEPLVENGKEVTNTTLLNGLAVAKSVGDVLLFLPVAWLPGFRLVDLAAFVVSHLTNGNFYSRLDAIRLDISNQGKAEISHAVQHRKLQQAKSLWIGSPSASYRNLAREYDLRSEDLASYLLVDPRDGSSISLKDEGLMLRVQDITAALVAVEDGRYTPNSTMVNVVARTTWNATQGRIADCEPWFVESPSTLPMLMLKTHVVLKASPKACLGVDAQALQHTIPKRLVRLRS